MKTARQQWYRLALVVVIALGVARPAAADNVGNDPLPSWNEGTTKHNIMEFVIRVTTEGHPDFVPHADRIATIDNDGTLWQEKPIVQGVFALSALKDLNPFDYTAETQLDPETLDEGAIERALKVYTNMWQPDYDAKAAHFLSTARHPTLRRKYTELVYQPMLELLAYLKARGFIVYICSGGESDFMRVVSQQLYGIPPERVIGSMVAKEIRTKAGVDTLWRLPQVRFVNNKETKPVNIDVQIGKRPVFAVGNEGGHGDIMMLRYSKMRPGPSFQLLVNHDDGEREFYYQELDNGSLKAAKQFGWTVISMKNDWRTIFPAP